MKKINNVFFVRVSSWLGKKNSHPENIMAPIDIGISISILKKNNISSQFIDTEIDKLNIKDIYDKIISKKPDVIFFWGITSSVSNIIELNKIIKTKLKNLISIAVGQHATEKPEIFLNNEIDYCISGEFDGIIEEIIKQLQNNKIIKNPYTSKKINNKIIIGKKYLVQELDKLPLPDHRLFYNNSYQVFHPVKSSKKLKWGFILSSRGCPYKCIYCSPTLRNSFGKNVRFRSVQSVINEMKFIQEIGYTAIYFKDDNFINSKEWIYNLCKGIKENNINIPWCIQTRVDNCDFDLLKKMKEANCSTISIGVESGSQSILNRLKKDINIDKIIDTFKITKQLGFYRIAFFMLGSPDESLNDILQTKKVLKLLNPDMIQVAFFTPYPGSTFFKLNNTKLNVELNNLSHYNKISNFSKVSDKDILQWQKKLYLYFLFNLGGIFKYYWNKRFQLIYDLRKELKFARLSLHFLLKRILNRK